MSEAIRILVVDDEVSLRSALVQVLEGMGHVVKTASNGLEALRCIDEAEEAIELLVTDVHMPGMRGDVLVRRLRENGSPPEILAMTGFGEKDLVVDLLRNGVGEYLDKPFSVADFVARVETIAIRVLERRIARAQSSHLTNRVVQLTGELARYQRGMESMKESFETAIDSYASLMELPKHVAGLNHASRLRALNYLGGDFIGISRVGEFVDVLVADVAGHDMGASYVTVLVKAFFENNREIGKDGPGFLRILNEGLLDHGSQKMVTACHARVDVRAGSLEISTCAHTAPILLRSGDGKAVEYECWGDPLGVTERIEIQSCRLQFGAGDRLFLFSDGIEGVSRYDPLTGKWMILGLDGIRERLESRCGTGLEEQVEDLWSLALETCRYSPDDDLLLLGIEGTEVGHVQG